MPREDNGRPAQHTSFFKGLDRHGNDAQPGPHKMVTDLCSEPPIIVTAVRGRGGIQRLCLLRRSLGTAASTHDASQQSLFLLCSVLIQKRTIGYGELFSGKREKRQDDEETQTTAPGTETQPR